MRNHHAHHRGYTLIELCIGLVITAMVMGGLATFSLAMSAAWQNAGASESALLSANHAVQLLQAKIRPCALTGGWRAGNGSDHAAVLLWTADSNADTFVNYSEILLIEHDPATHRINLYKAPVPLLVPDVDYSYSGLFSQASFIDTFRTALTPTILCNNVTDARFYVTSNNSATARPMVEFSLTVQNGSQTQQVYGDAVLRAPLAVPTN